MKRLTFLIIISVVTLSVFGQDNKLFKDGDRISFIGNSITSDGYYHFFIWFFYLTRYPEVHIDSYNCGVSGNSASDVLRRFDRDIRVHAPTVATLMLGMNDVNRDLYEPGKDTLTGIKELRKKAIENYKARIRTIATRLKEINCRLIFLTPSPYDQFSSISSQNLYGVNDALAECSDYLKSLAPEFNGDVVDFNHAMTLIAERELKNDPMFSIAGADRVHPLPWGHLIMSYVFLKTFHERSIVSVLNIDAGTKRIETDNCSVNGFKGTRKMISFDCLEGALPFPVPENAKQALGLVPFTSDFNTEMFSVKNLKKGDYLLMIDNDTAGIYSHTQLETGINLAVNENTPQYKQAAGIMKKGLERHRLISGSLRLMAMYDYGALFNIKDPADLNEIKIRLDQNTESAKGRPWYDYFKSSSKYYLQLKPKAAEITAETERMLQEIKNMVKPVIHHYLIIKIS